LGAKSALCVGDFEWVLLLERSQIAGPCHGEFALACFHDFIVHGISDHAPMVVQYGSKMKSGHEATGSICGREKATNLLYR